MEKLTSIGNSIKEKRLSLNLRMDDVAKATGITRSTLWAIEKGNSNYSINDLLQVMGYLGLSLSVDGDISTNKREKAPRKNTKKDKEINRFVVMCVEQYAKSTDRNSKSTYKDMLDKGVINELTTDYEDLHEMSTEYLNDFIGDMLRR